MRIHRVFGVGNCSWSGVRRSGTSPLRAGTQTRRQPDNAAGCRIYAGRMPLLGVVTALVVLLPSMARAIAPTAAEIAEAQRWATAKFAGVAEAKPAEAGPWVFGVEPPFSFTYDGKASAEFLSEWDVKRTSRPLDDNRTEYAITYTDPSTGLEIRCEAIAYADFPAVEWILHLTNKGSKDTPIVENVRALELALTMEKPPKECVIHHAGGSQNTTRDFGPIDDSLAAGASRKIGSQGMSSADALPFFNVDLGDHGMIAAVGWSGSWSAEFVRGTPESISVKAGMERTHLRLQPGETIRTPRMLVLFWQIDRIRGHNLWRRLILKHYSPRPGGEPLVGPLTDGNWGAIKAEDQIGKINWWVEHDLPLDCYWIDAGWSGKTGPMDSWMDNAANRVANPEYYPRGIREVSDAAHARGMRFLLWTWPHRAIPGVEVGAEHPDWLVNNEAIDHGNPAANRWMIEKYSRSIDEYGLDVFRQDGHPVIPADAEDRQGIHQIRHFEGFYGFWDTLLARHPKLIIDNCAGGGRKLDIETGKRSISLWRSDYQCPNDFEPIGMQGQTYGLAFYVPLSGGCSARTDPYGFRSGYSPALCINWHCYVPKIDDRGFDYDRARRLLKEYLAVRACFSGDYYPLTPYSVATDVWMAWQFDCPEQRHGMVQAFRRQESAYESMRVKLQGVEPDAVYTLTNMDVAGATEMTGRELMEHGFALAIPERPGAAVVRYQKKPQ